MKLLKDLGLEDFNPGVCWGPGWWSGADSRRRIDSSNPATEKPIASVGAATAADVETLIGASWENFRTWRAVPAPVRGDLVRRLGESLRVHKDRLGSLVSLETGKIKEEGDGEVQEMIDMADFAVGQSRMLYGKTMHSERPSHRMYEQWHPLGPVGVITAFNFPVAVWAWNALIAAICGNTVIWKPSPKAPLTAVAVQHLCNRVMEEAGYPGVFNLLVTDENPLAESLVQDRRIPLISFTGSTKVGRWVSRLVAARLGRSLLELSGNNAVIVDETADLDLAVPAVVFGAVGTAGQRCTTTRRLIVHENCYEELISRLIHAYRQLPIGDPLDRKTLVGPLIDAEAVAKFSDAIATLKQRGGEILYGGRVLERGGYFVEPTLVRAENHWEMVQRETFAPILYLIPFKTLEEAIALNNAVPQGFSSSLFTTHLQHAERFLSHWGSDCGIANINMGTSGAEIGGAFGGEKETGGGREAGSDAWKNYMRRQTNTINWGTELPLAQGIRFELEGESPPER
ncbi:Aldehyde dehydrogenase [Nitrosococcus oceani ATCC 19707]|uniref:aldehyde dehydrogenase (NAD(+)) n=2 Tax=Nitrosococcus oceani TaxID=1229 RepID=Q3JAG4_NITOC|nr:aldehyde dehydrogenase family protein [Nitrosococcus oceani]ABA58182.1 Aldehyde dehydrogenase [Nitrosococcus oceani ATCC 19707]EDZ67103.1 aldehyde dehydrogenase (NAD) family protein [Nitrosococcus oceani AFC27]KFI19395.1 aldehyde dehydrogenase [Nitrosococcus oceani C-27]GEM20402.1 aldehyde dehydrogenase family protein [Nitrosococcus oceani]